jgi:hypothetical protein
MPLIIAKDGKREENVKNTSMETNFYRFLGMLFVFLVSDVSQW